MKINFNEKPIQCSLIIVNKGVIPLEAFQNIWIVGHDEKLDLLYLVENECMANWTTKPYDLIIIRFSQVVEIVIKNMTLQNSIIVENKLTSDNMNNKIQDFVKVNDIKGNMYIINKGYRILKFVSLKEVEDRHFTNGRLFGLIEDQWLKFKNLYLDGDLITLFETSKAMWDNNEGFTGYLLERNGVAIVCIIIKHSIKETK